MAANKNRNKKNIKKKNQNQNQQAQNPPKPIGEVIAWNGTKGTIRLIDPPQEKFVITVKVANDLNQKVEVGKKFRVFEKRSLNEKRRKDGSPLLIDKLKPIQDTKEEENKPDNQEYRFYNPYLFVRLAEPKVNNRKSYQECWNLSNPGDRYSGQITVNLKTQTPLLIAQKVGNEGDRPILSFFTVGRENDPIIPATSIKGMIRSVHETICGSCLSQFDGDRRLDYRDTEQSSRMVPARVERNSSGELHLHLFLGKNKEPAINGNPPRQYAAWIRQYKRNKNNPIITLPAGLKHRDECWADIKDDTHTTRRGIELKISKVNQIDNNSHANWHKGYIWINDEVINNKHDERFFFNSSPNPVYASLPIEVINDFKSRIKDAKERLRLLMKKGKWSRYLLTPKSEELKEGDLVFAKLKEISKGQYEATDIGPVTISRLSRHSSIQDKIELPIRPFAQTCNTAEMDEKDKGSGLCPSCRLFGWVKEGTKKTTQEKNALAGRIRFHHGRVKPNAIFQYLKVNEEEKFDLAILSSPKPTTIPFYLRGDNPDKPHEVITQNPDDILKEGYDHNGLYLRGRKFYRHVGNKLKEQEYTFQGKPEHKNQSSIVQNIIKEGTFTFQITYEYLTLEEIGSLLWAIELNGNCVHRLGMGKPLGFGSVKLSIEDFRIEQSKTRYSFDCDPADNSKMREDAKSAFETSLCKQFGCEEEKDIKTIPHIAELLAILNEKDPDEAVHYPRPTKQPSNERDEETFRWFAENNRNMKNGQGIWLGTPTNDQGLPLLKRSK